MTILTCKINCFWEKQLIKNDYSGEELWVLLDELPEVLHSLLIDNKNTIKGVWFEGPYGDCLDFLNRYLNQYPNDDFSYTIN